MRKAMIMHALGATASMIMTEVATGPALEIGPTEQRVRAITRGQKVKSPSLERLLKKGKR